MAEENGANPDEREAGEVLSGLVTEHQPSWEPSLEPAQPTPPESEQDSDVDSEGVTWTRERWLAKHPDSSYADKAYMCNKMGWAMPRAGKEPMKRPRDEPEQPDLAEYLDGFPIPKKDHVTLCRAYASYIAATLPKKPSQKKKGKKQ